MQLKWSLTWQACCSLNEGTVWFFLIRYVSASWHYETGSLDTDFCRIVCLKFWSVCHIVIYVTIRSRWSQWGGVMAASHCQWWSRWWSDASWVTLTCLWLHSWLFGLGQNFTYQLHWKYFCGRQQSHRYASKPDAKRQHQEFVRLSFYEHHNICSILMFEL